MTRLSDQIGGFVTIPNTVMRIIQAIGVDAFALFCYFRWRTNGESGVAFPSYDTIQAETGLPRKRVAQAIRTLIGADLLTRKKRYGQSNEYTIHLPMFQNASSAGGTLSVVPQVHTNKTESNKTDILPEPPPAQPAVEGVRKLTPQQEMVGKLAEVLRLDAAISGARLGKFASVLLKNGYTPADVEQVYGADGAWWERDWRGKQKQPP